MSLTSRLRTIGIGLMVLGILVAATSTQLLYWVSTSLNRDPLVPQGLSMVVSFIVTLAIPLGAALFAVTFVPALMREQSESSSQTHIPD